MKHPPERTLIYHITDVENLPGIVAAGGLHSDAHMAGEHPEVIGYGHIKERRMTEIKVPCCGGRFVGEFVPFYFCPRSPMLYTVNRGNTGRPAGCQKTILHLVSTVAVGLGTGRPWAISDGNAGASHTNFSSSVSTLDELDWQAIEANYWQGQTHQKSSEFLLADFFPWEGICAIACYDSEIVRRVLDILPAGVHHPELSAKPHWYY